MSFKNAARKTSRGGWKAPPPMRIRVKRSLCSGATRMLSKAFSMSPVKATLFNRNLGKMSYNKGNNDGPASKQSFKLGPPDLAEASNTTRSLVVSLSGFKISR